MPEKEYSQNGGTLRFALCDSTMGEGQAHCFNVVLKAHNVVILHPSLGCPALAKPGAELHVFLLADADFQQLLDTDPETQPLPANAQRTPNPGGTYFKQGGPRVKAVINRLLKLFPWNNGKVIADKTLYEDTPTALANIEVYSLGDTNGLNDGRIKDKDGHLFALLRESTRAAYAGSLKANYLFEVVLKPGAMSPPPKEEGLYDLAWLLPDPTDPKSLSAYAEPQDRATREFVRGHLKDRTHAYAVKSGAFEFHADPTRPSKTATRC